MSTILKENLRENEKVLWEGKPEQVKLLEPPFHISTIINWSICLAGVLLLVIYINYAGNAAMDMTKAFQVSGVGLAIIILVALTPLLDLMRLKSKVFYYVTNERFISIREGATPKMEYRDFADVNEIGVDTLSTGLACLCVNPTGGTIMKKARTGINEKNSDNYKFEPLFFYSVTNAEKALESLPGDILVTRDWTRNAKANGAPTTKSC